MLNQAPLKAPVGTANPRPRNSKKFTAIRPDLRLRLQAELLSRCRTNPKYSLRAFARFLGIESSRLSKILRGQRPIGLELLEKFAVKLRLSESELVAYKNAIKNKFSTSDSSEKEFQQYLKISQDAFETIEDWRHYAILELMKLDTFQPNKEWIAKSLKLTQSETQTYVNRLERIGLLEISETGKWRDTSEGFSTDILSEIECTAAHSRGQISILKLASEAVETIPMAERDQSSMMMATSHKKIIEAKMIIKKFRRQLTAFLEDCDEKDSVYQLSISLFPLSTEVKNTKKAL